jgi:hypothetical protein
MLHWVDYSKKLLARIGELGELSPGNPSAYQSLLKAGHKTGRLDARPRELIALEPQPGGDGAVGACGIAKPFERQSAGPIDIGVRELHHLRTAAELMESLFQELGALSGTDAVLSFDLMMEGPAISEQLSELREFVNRLSAASNLNNDLARAKALVGPLSRRLDTLARTFEARNS